MNKLTKTLALITLAIVTLSIIPTVFVLSAQTYASKFTVLGISSSRTTGTIFKNQEFYVLIDLSTLDPIDADTISIAVRGPYGGYYYTYPIYAYRIGETLTFITWFKVYANGTLGWGGKPDEDISKTRPTTYAPFRPGIVFTAEGQYLTITAGTVSFTLYYQATEAKLKDIPAKVYADGVTPTTVGWKIIAPDLNTDPLEQDDYYTTNIIVAKVRVLIDGTWYGPFDVQLLETEANSGVFEIKNNIFTEKDIKDKVVAGKTITFEFRVAKWLNADLTKDEEVWILKTSVFVEKAPPISISVDRTEVPLSDIFNPYICVTVVDAGRAAAKEPSVNVAVKVYKIDGTEFTSLPGTLGRVEGTNNYYGCVEIPTTGWADPKLIKGWLVVEYVGSDDKTYETPKITLNVYPVSISVMPSTVKFGDKIVLEVRDPRLNMNASKVDEITIGDLVNKEVLKISGGELKNMGIKLKETDINSGCFKAELIVAMDKDIYGVAGSTIKLEYVNGRSPLTTPDMSEFLSETVSASFTISKFIGKLSTSKPTYYPYEKVEIIIEDPDRNENVGSKDLIPGDKVFIRKADKILVNLAALGVSVEETDVNTGIFKATVPIERLGSLDDVLTLRNIDVLYRDDVSPEGISVITYVFRVVSEDGVVKTDKTAYLVGEKIKIEVVDPDQNDPSKYDNIQVTVKSTTDPVGVPVYLWETAPDSGVFVGEVLISDKAIGIGYILARLGDKITIEYKDRWPADFYVTGKSKVITREVGVGIPVEKPITLKKADFIDPKTGVSVIPKVGSMVGISVELSNVGVTDQVFTAILVVKDPEGVVVKVDSVSIPLAAGKSGTVTFSYIPKLVGDYTVEVYIVKSLADWTPLGDMLTKVMSVVS
jgi:hypothetical protein